MSQIKKNRIWSYTIKLSTDTDFKQKWVSSSIEKILNGTQQAFQDIENKTGKVDMIYTKTEPQEISKDSLKLPTE